MITDLREILTEWSYRTSDGKPDVNNNAKLILLEGVLTEFGWSREAKAELLNNLIEKTLVKNKDSGAVYLVKNVNDEKHDILKKNASEDDLDKEKDDEEPDVEEPINDKKVDDKLKQGRIKKMKKLIDKAEGDIITDEVKEQIPNIIGKMMGNEELSEEEENLIKKHIKFVRTEGGRVDAYLALNKERVWYPAVSQKVNILEDKTAPDNVLDWMDNLENQYDWVFVGNSSEGAIGKKQLNPNRMTEKRKINTVTENKDGSITVNKRVMKKLKVPSEEITIKAVRINNPNMSDDEVKETARIRVNQIERYNSQIDDLRKTGSFETVDYGPVSTPEERRATMQNIIGLAEKRIRDLLKKANREDSPENDAFFKQLDVLKGFKDIDTENNEEERARFVKETEKLLVLMAANVDLKDTAADFNEVRVTLEKLSQGNSVYVPSSETFKISDIVIINPIDTSKLNIDDADKLAESLKLINSSIEITAGESVKYRGGGGGISDDKIRLTVYNNKETRKQLYRLTGISEGDDKQPGAYDFMYPSRKRSKNDNPPYPPTSDSIAKEKAKSEDIMNWSKRNNLMSDAEEKAVNDFAESRGNDFYEKFIKNGVGEGCDWDEDDYTNYKKSIKEYLKQMKMMEIINNNDTKYTKFANSNLKIKTSTKKTDSNPDGKRLPVGAETEELDGIKKPCYMKFKEDPGFTYSKNSDGCVTATPTNRNPSEIHSEKQVY